MLAIEWGRGESAHRAFGGVAKGPRLLVASERFRAVFDHAGIGMAITDVSHRILDVNAVLESFLGYTAAELRGMSILDIAFGDEREAALRNENFRRLAAGEIERFQTVKRYVRKDGATVWGRLTVTMAEEEGRPLVIGMVEDLTAFRRTQEHLNAVTAALPIVVFGTDAKGRYTFAQGRGLAQMGHDLQDKLRQLIADGKPSPARMVVEDQVWETIYEPLHDDRGEPDGVVGVAVDVTERARAETELRETEARLRSVINNAPLLLFVIDKEGTLTFSAGKGLAQLGLKPGDHVGRSVFELNANNDTLLAGTRRVLAGEAVSRVVEMAGRVFEMTCEPVRTEAGDVAGAIGILVDVTDRAMAARRQAAIAHLGQLALGDASMTELARKSVEEAANELRVPLGRVIELLTLSGSGASARLVASLGWPESRVGTIEDWTPTTLADQELTRYLREPRPIIVPNWAAEKRYLYSASLEAASVVSSLEVPIGGESGCPLYGWLSVSDRRQREFTPDEVSFMQSLANVLAEAFARLKTEEHLRALVERAPDVIARYDRDLRLVYVNPTVERLSGRAVGDFVGKTAHDLNLREPQRAAFELALRQVIRSGHEESIELSADLVDGERVFDTRLVPELALDGSVNYVLAVSRDVTSERHAEAERQGSYRELLERQQRLQELVSRTLLGHEQDLRKAAARAHGERLTKRERQVLRLVAAGWSNPEIGGELGVTAGTVKNRVARILKKLDATDRTQAAVRALDLGLIEPIH
ncbi:MAG TPA: PAS domain S-box protein [Chloroflexota bacterium]|jgi:PAS domain S-box-containing protein|nr:PAS domain S-box protein [Chloroflexota bacterium]